MHQLLYYKKSGLVRQDLQTSCVFIAYMKPTVVKGIEVLDGANKKPTAAMQILQQYVDGMFLFMM